MSLVKRMWKARRGCRLQGAWTLYTPYTLNCTELPCAEYYPVKRLPPAALASLCSISRRLDRAHLTHAGTGRMPTVSGRA